MIQINLLPDGEGGRRTKGRSATAGLTSKLSAMPGDPWTVGVAVALIAALLLLGFTYWRTSTVQATLADEIRTLQADSARHADVIERATLYRARRDTLEERIGIIREIDERRYVWAHVLDEVSRAVPEYTWLTGLRTTGRAQNGQPGFVLEGNVGTTQALTRFIRQLETSPFIRNVELVTAEQVRDEGRTFDRFTIEAMYRQPEREFIETVPIVVPE